MKRLLLIGLLLVGLQSFVPHCVTGQLQDGDIIISEFFNDIYLVDPGTRSQSNIYNENRFLQNLAGVGDYIYSYDFGAGLIEINLAQGTTTVLADLSIDEVTIDPSNNVVIASTQGVQRYNRSTGMFSTLTSDRYDDLVVSAQGEIFVTDTFDGVGRLADNGSFESVFDPGFAFDDLTIGADGFIYTYSSFDGLYRINPQSGTGVQLDDTLFTFFDELVALEDGGLLMSGALDVDGDGLVDDGLFRYDPGTGELVSILDEVTDGLSLWSPSDVYVVGGLYATVPEPTTVPLMGLAAFSIFCRRKK